MKKRKRMENFEIQALRNVVKENGPDVVENCEKKFKEVRIEGKRKSLSSSTMFTETLPSKYYTETEKAEIEAMYMGTESEARKRFLRNNYFNRMRQSFDGRQQFLFWGSQYGSNRYNPISRYEGFKYGGRESLAKRDQS